MSYDRSPRHVLDGMSLVAGYGGCLRVDARNVPRLLLSLVVIIAVLCAFVVRDLRSVLLKPHVRCRVAWAGVMASTRLYPVDVLWQIVLRLLYLGDDVMKRFGSDFGKGRFDRGSTI